MLTKEPFYQCQLADFSVGGVGDAPESAEACGKFHSSANSYVFCPERLNFDTVLQEASCFACLKEPTGDSATGLLAHCQFFTRTRRRRRRALSLAETFRNVRNLQVVAPELSRFKPLAPSALEQFNVCECSCFTRGKSEARVPEITLRARATETHPRSTLYAATAVVTRGELTDAPSLLCVANICSNLPFLHIQTAHISSGRIFSGGNSSSSISRIACATTCWMDGGAAVAFVQFLNNQCKCIRYFDSILPPGDIEISDFLQETDIGDPNAEIHAISADLQLDISAVGNLLVRSGTLFSNESFHMLNPDSAIATKNNEVECVQSYEGRLRAVQNYDGKTYCYVSTGFDVVLRNNRTASSKFLTVAADAEPAAKSRLVYSKAAGMWFPPGIGLRKPRVALPPLQRVAVPRPDVECAGQCNSVKECLFAEIFASTFSDFQGVLMKPPPPLPPAPPSNPPPLEPVVHHPPPSSPPERDWQLHPEKLTCGLKCASFAATVFEGGASSNLVEELGQKGVLKNSRCPFECLPAVSELSTANLLKIPDATGTYFVATVHNRTRHACKDLCLSRAVVGCASATWVFQTKECHMYKFVRTMYSNTLWKAFTEFVRYVVPSESDIIGEFPDRVATYNWQYFGKVSECDNSGDCTYFFDFDFKTFKCEGLVWGRDYFVTRLGEISLPPPPPSPPSSPPFPFRGPPPKHIFTFSLPRIHHLPIVK